MLGIARRKGLTSRMRSSPRELASDRSPPAVTAWRFELLIKLPSLQDREQAQALIGRAEQRWPYSNAVRGNVEVTLSRCSDRGGAQRGGAVR